MNEALLEIVKKELKVTFKSKSSILSMLFAIGIPFFAFAPLLAAAEKGSMPTSMVLLMLLLIPTEFAFSVGMNAFPNEIRWRTIKFLLVAPVSEREILVGKSLACVVAGLVVEGCVVAVLAFLPVPLDASVLITLLVIGPLLIAFSTFLIVLTTTRFPSSTEGGAAAFIPVGGLMGIFFLCFFLQMALRTDPTLTSLAMASVMAVLTFSVYSLAAKWFDRERLVTAL